jgi:hypothetical protein
MDGLVFCWLQGLPTEPKKSIKEVNLNLYNMATPVVTQTPGVGKINWIDVLNGLIVAAVTGGLTVLENALTSSPIVINWKAVGVAALAGGVAYLVKNLGTKSRTVITGLPEGATAHVTIPVKGASAPTMTVEAPPVAQKPAD